jgi:tRNA A37 threonylcarbamoyladenosine dehydratase
MDPHSRTRILLGEEAVERLKNARILLFGLGGVGGYAAEALARGGIGHMDLVDNDTISLTNLNRQILATHDTLGMRKTEAAKARIHSIDPDIEVTVFDVFFLPETADAFDFTRYDYVLDAIDTVTGKLEIIARAKAAGVPVISCMGTGNKLDASGFKVADISKTSGCALARIMRKECGKRGIKGVKVVYSEELPTDPIPDPNEPPEPQREGSSRRSLPGSTPFVPGVAGLIMAGEVIRDLAGK